MSGSIIGTLMQALHLLSDDPNACLLTRGCNGRPPSDSEVLAGWSPFELEGCIGRPLSEPGGRVGRPPSDSEGLAGRSPFELEGCIGRPLSEPGGGVGGPLAEPEGRVGRTARLLSGCIGC